MEDNHMKQLWRRACGEVPQGFINRLHRSLGQASKRQPQRCLRPILSAALVLVFLLGSAFALESLGVLDTLNRILRRDLLPQAQEIVESSIPQKTMQPELARFTVEEAVYDGHQVYLTLHVQPEDPAKALLMDQEAEPAWAYDWKKSGNPYQGESFAEKAKAAGQKLVQVEVWDILVNEVLQHPQIHQSLYEAGGIRYTLSVPAQGEEANLRLNLLAMDISKQMDDSARGTLDFTLTQSPHIKEYSTLSPVLLPEARLTLTLCKVETTPIASYLTLRYALLPDSTPLQAVNMRDGLQAEWLDGAGNPREAIWIQDALKVLPEGGIELNQVYGALEEAPGDITLSFYNIMTQERFDHITLALSPKEEN